jgi:hypothetical protein
MIAERKAIRNQNVSYLAVTYYSLFTVILSIFDTYYKVPYPVLDKISLAASVIVLVASLVAAGFRFEARAAEFRDCYLRLQRLFDQPLTEDEKKDRYREMMLDFPNHSPADYTDMVINHTLIEEKQLYNDNKKIDYNWKMMTSWLIRKITYYGLLLFLFGGPLVFLLLPLVDCKP